MRVLLITQGVSRVVEPLLNSTHHIVAIADAAPRNFKAGHRTQFRQAVRATIGMIFSHLRTLKQFSTNRGIPYYHLTSEKMEDFGEWVRTAAPDVIVVFSMSQLLPSKVFEIPPLGTINLHPSFLPDYRGPNPDFWQYYFTELTPGCTVHYIDVGEDTGDIIHQVRVPIALGEKSPEVLHKLIDEAGVSLLLRALDDLDAGGAPRTAQPPRSMTVRARNIKPDEHDSLIDWETWPIERIWHLLRGTDSWLNALPPPTGVFKGQRWEVLNFERRNTSKNKSPASIYRDEIGPYVVCNDGVIRLSVRFSVSRLVRNLLARI